MTWGMKVVLYDHAGVVDVYVVDEAPAGSFVIHPSPGELRTYMRTRIGEAETLEGKEFLRLPDMLARDFLPALVSAMNAKGIKTEDQLKREGRLEQMAYHLEDMRTMLKLRKPQEPR